MAQERSVKKPGTAAAHKALWADPEYREKLLAKRQHVRERRALVEDPINNSRKGIPTGYTRVQAQWFRRQAALEATLTMKKLERAGIITAEDEYANEALHTALKVMRGPDNLAQRLSAAKLVLEYTKCKPVQRQEVSISKAEEWLEAVTQDAKADERSDSGPQEVA